jgi:hypothetical protein
MQRGLSSKSNLPRWLGHQHLRLSNRNQPPYLLVVVEQHRHLLVQCLCEMEATDEDLLLNSSNGGFWQHLHCPSEISSNLLP